MNLPLVSVIVPCFNSQKYITDCLESLKNQTYKNIEILVVDNPKSNDKTKEIAKKYTKHIFVKGKERSAQINYAAKMAKGKYLYRVDSDFVLEPNVIKECVEKCEKEILDGIAIHNTSADGLGFWADIRKYERNSYKDDNLIVAVRFFTKKAWKTVGGFDETLYGPEDYDFHNRFIQKRFKWGRIKAIERHLGEPKSLSDIWRKHYFYGKQMVSYFRKYPSIATRQFIPIRKSYLREWKIFFQHPLIFLGLIIMSIVKFTAGGLGFFYALSMKKN